MLSPRRFRLMLLGAVSSTAFSTAHAADVVLPTGTIQSVSSGTVTSASSRTQTTVTQTSARAVINWSNLSVASGDTLEFVQPNSSSITLNRVVGPSGGGPIAQTQINGTVNANGQVWILNPSGVLVGGNGRVNVAGFLASTLGIADADFNAATDAFNLSGDNSTLIENRGIITASGYAVLAGHRVENSGTVQAQLGTVALGSGRAMSLSFSADKLISFVVSEPATAQGSGIFNTLNGQIIANGGRVLMTARVAAGVAASVVNSAGLVQASSVSVKNGEITLDAGQTGDIEVSGKLNATGTGAGETGGVIRVTGRNIYATSTSQFLASGRAGGGSILIGLGPVSDASPSQTQIFASTGSTFDASAEETGAGGLITLLSDYNDPGSFIGFNGNFSANGGGSSGAGGTIEAFFSSLDLSGSNTTDATKPGEAAQLKFNANNIEISNVSGSGGRLTQTTVQDLLNAGHRLSLNAIGEGADSGNISIASSITKTSNLNAMLSLSADNDISVLSDANISATDGSLSVSFSSDQNGDGIGLTHLGADVSLLSGSKIEGSLLAVKSNLTFSHPVILDSSVNLAADGDVLFKGSLDSATTPFNLNVYAGTGDISFNENVGTGGALAGLTVKSATFRAKAIIGNSNALFKIETSGGASIADTLTGSKLTKAGAGRLSLSGAADVATISIEEGRLRPLAPSGTALRGASILIGSGGVLDLASPQTANSTMILSLSGAGRVELADEKLLELVNGLATDSFSGIISGSASSTVKVSGGTLTLTGDTGFAGLIKVDGATLNLTGRGSIASASGLSVGARNGAVIDLGGISAASTTIRNFFTDTSTRTGLVLLGSKTLVIDTVPGVFGVNSLDILGEGGSLEKTGMGSLRLVGANSYSGDTRVRLGVLEIPTETQLGRGSITLGGGTLRFISGGVVSLTKSVTLVADSAIEFVPDLVGTKTALPFKVTWSGARFNNAASAIGLLSLDPSLFSNLGGQQNFSLVGDGLTINSVTVRGADIGNGTFGPADFSNYYFSAVNSLDNTRELIGQPMANGFKFGSFADGYEGQSGDFNLFRNDENFNAPTGTSYFELTTAGGSGNKMAVVSIVPSVAVISNEALISGAINGGFSLRIAANGNLALLGRMGNSQPLAEMSAGAIGTLRLGANAQIAATGDIRLKTLTRFLNESVNASALASANGTWRVYSGNSNPFGGSTADVAGGLGYDFKAYGIDPLRDFNAPEARGFDGFIYAYSPTLTVTSANPITKVYDGTTALVRPLPALTATSSVSSDVLSVSGTPAGQFATADASSTSVLLSGFSISAVDAVGKPIFGYSVSGSTTLAATITPKPIDVTLTGALSRVYDGTTGASLSASNFAVSGLVSGESLSITQMVGSYASKDTGSQIVVTAKVAQADFVPGNGTLLTNYVLPTTASGTIGYITPKVLTVSLTGTTSKVYDNSSSAQLSASNFVLDGLVSGESLKVSQPSGTYASKNAGSQINVTADVSPANFMAGSGTLLTNYILPSTTVSGVIGEITLRTLNVSLVGTAQRAYDGTRNATLTSDNYTLSGIANGDNLTVTQTQGLYASKDVGTQISVSALLTSSNYMASGTTLLSNYALPTTASGAIGEITKRALSVAIIGSLSRTYNGGVAATLSGSNYALSGFADGEGILIGQTQASYGAKDVGKNITVTVSLPVSAFSGVGTTSIGNYALPNTASGAIGEITPRTLTYVADTAERPAKTENPVFKGTVNGFAGSETVASATTGSLAFLSDATTSSLEGYYAINGTGLAATNYVFEQASSNATALTVKAALPNIAQLVTVVPVSIPAPVVTVAPPQTVASAPAPAPAAAPSPAPAAATDAAPVEGPAAAGPSGDDGKPAAEEPAGKPSEASPAGGDADTPSSGDAPPTSTQAPATADAPAPSSGTAAAPAPANTGSASDTGAPVAVVAVAALPVAPLPPSPVPSTPPPTPADDVDGADPILQSVVEAPAPPPPTQRASAIVSQLSPFVSVSVPLPVRPAGVPGIDTRYSLTGNPAGM